MKATAHDPTTRTSGWVWDAACIALVLVLRVVLLLATRDDPVFRVPYLDGAFYHTWARSLAAGQGDFEGPYFLGPLYPRFLSLLYGLAGPDPWVVRLVQTLFGGLDAVFVLCLGRRLFGTNAGRAAVVLFAFYGPLPFHENLLVMESLLVTLSLAALFLLFVPRRWIVWRGAAVGLLLGLASMGRPTVLAAVPVVLWALRRGSAGTSGDKQRDRGPLAWRAPLVCGLAWLLILVPVVVRNARLGGGLVIATNGGVNFFAGNNDKANGRFHEPQGVRFFRDPVFESAAQASLPPAVAARALTVRAVAGTPEAADSRRWTRAALAWLRAHPIAAVQLQARKVWLMLQAREIPQIESYDFQRQRLAPLRPFVVDFGWLWPLLAIGVWQARRARTPGWGIVAAYGSAMSVPCLAFFVTSRYRLAVVPEVVLFAGAGAVMLLGWVMRREFRSAAIGLLAIAPLALLARLGAAPPRNAAGWDNAQMAERLYALGDLAGAIRYEEHAVAALPDRYEPALNLALYRSERGAPGDLASASSLLQDLARRWPRQAVVQFNLGVVLEQECRLEEARQAWRRALEADPSFEPARSRLLATETGATRARRPPQTLERQQSTPRTRR
jgi:tetratricopeptide (TPR) repeat protein